MVVGQHGSRRGGASQKRRLSWNHGWAERRYPAARRLEGHGCLIGIDNSSVWLIRDVGAPGTRTVVGRKQRGALHTRTHITPDTTCCYCNAAERATPPANQDNHNFSLDSTPGLNRKRAWSVRNSNLPKPNSYPQPTNHPKHTQNAQAPNPALSYQFSRVGCLFCLARVDFYEAPIG